VPRLGARNFDQLKLAESEEMKQTAYLENQPELNRGGFSCDAVLALGDPRMRSSNSAREKNVDLMR